MKPQLPQPSGVVPLPHNFLIDFVKMSQVNLVVAGANYALNLVLIRSFGIGNSNKVSP